MNASMFRHLGRFLALVVCVANGAPLLAASTSDEIERLRSGVVRIYVDLPLGGHKEGTGIVVRRDADSLKVLTASHVVEGARDIAVEFHGQRGRPIPTRTLAMEGGEDHGLAVLAATPPTQVAERIKVLPLLTGLTVRPGDPVAVIGFPRRFNVPWMHARGEFVGRKAKLLVFAANVDEGNSGGPLIVDGQVIGIVTQTQAPISYAVPAIIARYILEGWGITFGVRLRGESASLPLSYVAKMVKDHGFSHPYDLSGEGLSGSSLAQFENDFELQELSGARVVLDRATGLMWQGDGSEQRFRRREADSYIKRLNRQGFAGFRDWRLPTVEELGSLLEPLGTNSRLYIDRMFTPVIACWTADDITVDEGGEMREGPDYVDQPVFVDFAGGSIDYNRGHWWTSRNLPFVRAVRDAESIDATSPATPEERDTTTDKKRLEQSDEQ